jgi:hypothetical protein
MHPVHRNSRKMTPATTASLSHHSNSERREEKDDTMESSSSGVDLEEALPQEEKDRRDHLTPTALVRAASHPAVQNADDLEKGDAAEMAHVDKVLASVPPSLERQTALPSQPGAFRAGGDGLEQETDRSGSTAPPVTSLIEATLVEESAPPVVVAPVYKGQIVLSEEAPRKENVVMLSKRQVRCFLVAFALLCFVAIVLSVVLSVVELHGNDSNGNEEDKEVPDFHEGYWYERDPEELWKLLQDRPFITHHMALVSIVNPNMTLISDDDNAELQCSSLRDDFGDEGDPARALRHEEFSNENVVVISFTCGSEQIDPPPVVHGVPRPEAILLMHDGNSLALNGNQTILCQDAKHFHNGTLNYNEVFCAIPNDDRIDGTVLAFLFSCFSRSEQEPVASVRTQDLSAECHIVNSSSTFVISNEDDEVGNQEGGVPAVFVASAPAVLLSTQRLCRVDAEILLQSHIRAEVWRNRSQNCSQGWVGNDDSDLLVCRSETFLGRNQTLPLNVLPVCASKELACFDVRLPNVTIYDQLQNATQCSFSSMEESLMVKGENDLPGLPPWNEATLEELQEFSSEQALWVEQWLLPLK